MCVCVCTRSSTESANGDSEMESLLDTGKSKRSEFNSLPLSEWGPVGFKRSNHPLSIMVSGWSWDKKAGLLNVY